MRSASRIEERPTPKLSRQLALGWKWIARLEPARADLPEQLLGDLLVDLAALEWLIAHGLSDQQTSEEVTPSAR